MHIIKFCDDEELQYQRDNHKTETESDKIWTVEKY